VQLDAILLNAHSEQLGWSSACRFQPERETIKCTFMLLFHTKRVQKKARVAITYFLAEKEIRDHTHRLSI
jgi:hypothetical protein